MYQQGCIGSCQRWKNDRKLKDAEACIDRPKSAVFFFTLLILDYVNLDAQNFHYFLSINFLWEFYHEDVLKKELKLPSMGISSKLDLAELVGHLF